jgi:hypothetical protein
MTETCKVVKMIIAKHKDRDVYVILLIVQIFTRWHNILILLQTLPSENMTLIPNKTKVLHADCAFKLFAINFFLVPNQKNS